jgi:arginase family enzyme
VPLGAWQEAIRFASTRAQMQALTNVLAGPLHNRHGVVFLGNGDFHHVSYPLIAHVSQAQCVEVIVLDNHPDNMRWIGEIHCGSWVRRVGRLANVIHVHVLGITSLDISTARLWENYLTSLWQGRLTYWGVRQTFGALHGLVGRNAFRNFDTPDALCASFIASQRRSTQSAYLSIDKDVLGADVVRTNWDQGCFNERHVNSVIDVLAGRLVGADITGELSSYQYSHPWKRWLSARDARPCVDLDSLTYEQTRHGQLNTRLAERIAGVMDYSSVSA